MQSLGLSVYFHSLFVIRTRASGVWGPKLLSLFLDAKEMEGVCGEVSAGVGVDRGARSLDSASVGAEGGVVVDSRDTRL